jgi:phage gp46-like protein
MATEQSIDIKLTQDDSGLYDISIKDDDFESVEGFESAITTSLFTDGRAPAYNIPDSFRRRGWIGNIGTPKLPTSLLWLLDQSRLNQSTLNSARLYAQECLQWMTDNLIARTIDVDVTSDERGAVVSIALLGYSDQSNRFYIIWKETGRQNGR